MLASTGGGINDARLFDVAKHGELRMVGRDVQLFADGLGLGRCLVVILDVHLISGADGLVVMLPGGIGFRRVAFGTVRARCDGVGGHVWAKYNYARCYV